MTYSVKYTNPPENLFLSNNPPEKLNVSVEAHGFTLLRQKLSFSLSPVVLNLTDIKNSESISNNTIVLQSEGLLRRISGQVSNEISVNDVEPGILTLVFDSLDNKMVPVIPDVKLQFKAQFFLNGEITVEPDSIELTGPASIIDTVKAIKTQTKNFEVLDAPVNLMVPLNQPEKINVEPKKVNLKIPVERFTEKKIKIPISVLNRPQGSHLKIFPSDAEVSFLVGLSQYETINSSDFDVVVIFDSAQIQQTLEVKLRKQPDYIQQLRVSPPNVEYLIETEE